MRVLFVLLVLSVFAGCGDTGVVEPDGDTGGKDVVVDTKIMNDTAQVDTAAADTSLADTTAADTGRPSGCDPGEGCFGESCDSADDCLSGICTMHLGDKVCSKTCDETCPLGWNCTLAGSGGDSQYVCVSKFSHLCLPCETAEGCAGDVPNACVKYADGTRFCGGTCDLENPCPSGYACQEVETANGAKSYQCTNTAGVCPCSTLAIESALSTPCETTNAVGNCQGIRLCEDTGLSACSAGDAVMEVCNGIDDNCDGSVDEATCDDGNPCTVDSCTGEGGCVYDALTGDECLDGDPCTVTDHCEDGVCVGQPVNCDDNNPCTLDTCDGLGGCQHPSASQLCDDEDPCTLGDVCKEGDCVGSATLTCDDGNPCTDDSCGEAGCVFEANASVCDDGNACTSSDACSGGACKGVQVVCDDANLCTTDSCDLDAGCLNTNNAQPCDDGDTCTLGDMCGDGGCVGGAALPCDDGNPCTDDGCDSGLGCVFSANALDCDDKNSCTSGDACAQGNCIGFGVLTCDDGNSCTVDSCLADGGCQSVPAVGACDDGDACTVNDSCQEGACQSGLSLSCNDGNTCTDESCVEGDCVFTSNAAACDDGNACTDTSSCKAGACVATTAVECDDENPCTSDGCDPQSGCIHVDNVLECTDGDVCTLGDGCVDGACQPGEGGLACDDGNGCTDDSCQPVLGCLFSANEAACDDGNACTLDESCKNGGCAFGALLACDDGNGCTDDGCKSDVGCVTDLNQALCDDGDACTSADVCADGVCAGAESVPCDDGVFCNGVEVCDPTSGCVDGANPQVDDGVTCTVDACDEEIGAVTHTPDAGACGAADGLCTVAVCDLSLGCTEGVQPDCCGNALVEEGEGCDDGNLIDNDECTNGCALPSCDDGILNGDEEGVDCGGLTCAGCCKVGELDQTFGEGGKLIIDLGDGTQEINSVTVQPDGKILATGRLDGDFAVIRLLPDGSLDPDFATQGLASMSFNWNSQGESVALQEDGKVVVGGGTSGGCNLNEVFIARLLADGSFDPGFGNGGRWLSSFNRAGSGLSSVAIQPDGRIVGGGTVYNSSNCSSGVMVNMAVQVSASGAFLTHQEVNMPGLHDNGRSIDVMSDGSIVMGGGDYYAGGSGFNLLSFSAELNFVGTTGYGGGRVDSIVVQPNGQVVVTGEKVIRVNADMSLDNGFGQGGQASVAVGNGWQGGDRSVALQSDGKILVTSYTMSGFGLIRYKANGVPDETFGPNKDGIATFQLTPGTDRSYSVAVQPDGGIILGGTVDVEGEPRMGFVRVCQ